MDNLEQIIADTLLERPVGFGTRHKHYYLYPPTMGKVYLNGALIKEIGIDTDNMQKHGNIELLRVFVEKNDICLRLIAINTFEGKECLDNVKVEKRIRELRTVLIPDDGVLLLTRILSEVGTDGLQKELGITDELAAMRKAQSQKPDKTTKTFCGKTVWGSMISTLAEKYGWTMQYIMWGITMANVQMLLADSIKTVYLSNDDKVLDGNDPATWEKLKNFHWD